MSIAAIPQTMRVVELRGAGGPQTLVPATRPVPEPESDQLLVAVGACGVCGHDVLARRGLLSAEPGTVLGHEIAGTVVATGSEVTQTQWLGQRVALVQRIPCGACADCAAGMTNLCRKGPGFYGEDLPGGYAQYVIATPRNAVRLPDSVDDATGAMLSCAVGTGLRALRSAAVDPGQPLVVTGAGGGVGVHTVQLAMHSGARVVAVTGSPYKAAALRELGADAVLVRPDTRELRTAIAELGGRRGAEAVIEVAGGPTFEVSLRALAPRGRLVLVGNTEPAAFPLDPGLTILKELRVHGSAHADIDDLEKVVSLVASEAVTVTPASRWPLDEARLAHEAVDSRSVTGRAVIVP